MSWDLTMYAICGGPCPDPPKRKVYIIGSLRNGQVPVCSGV
jgi:hypothetical protein